MKIGCDITKISRFQEISPAFFQKYFTKQEREYINRKGGKLETVAGMFSAKEAVFKTFGTTEFPVLSNIEIIHDGSIPKAKLHGEYKEKYGEYIEISISHDGEYAMTNAIREELENGN